MSGEQFTMPVPVRAYTHILVHVTATNGASTVSTTLRYADQTTTPDTATVADWVNPPNAASCLGGAYVDRFNLTNDRVERVNGCIYSIDLVPAPGRDVASVDIKNIQGGWLVFFAATGW